MTTTSELREIVSRQKSILADLETEVAALESADVEAENKRLRSSLEKEKADGDKARAALMETQKRLQNTQNALTAQMLREKFSVLETVNRRVDLYYLEREAGAGNRLLNLEKDCRKRIDELFFKVQQSETEQAEALNRQIEAFAKSLDEKIAAMRALEAQAKKAYTDEKNAKFQTLRQEGVTSQELEKSLGRKSWETFVGLNVFNKIGIFLLIIGAIAAGQYTFTRIGDVFKSVLLYLLGVALIAGGEVITRKRRANVFAQGLISGGVAVLYVATAVTYFVLKLISPQTAFLLCVLVAAGAFALSMLHRSQTISAFAVIGGYLPLWMLYLNRMPELLAGGYEYPVLAVYLTVLSAFVFAVSLRNRWHVTLFLGYALQLPATCGLAYVSASLSSLTGKQSYEAVAIAVAALTVLVYLGSVFFGTGKEKKLSAAQFVLTCINVGVGTVLLLTLTGVFFTDFLYIPALALTLIYAAAAWYSAARLQEEARTTLLFFISAVVMSFCVVPLKFGFEYASLAWLLESAVLLSIGTFKKGQALRVTGFVCFALSTLVVFIQDLLSDMQYTSENGDFALDAAWVTFPLLVVSAALILLFSVLAKRNKTAPYRVFACTFLPVTIGFIAFLTERIADLGKGVPVQFIYGDHTTETLLLQDTFSGWMGFFLLSLVFLIGFSFLRAFRSGGTTAVSALLSGGLFIGLCVALFFVPFGFFETWRQAVVPTGVLVRQIAFMVLACLAGVAAILRICKLLQRDFGWSAQVVPVFGTVSFVLVLTLVLTRQFGLRFTNPVISILYVLAALSWIIWGFLRRYTNLRKSGLVLSFVALAKLFIIDLFGLGLLWRIISFFVFGGILIAVSFIYQYYSKRIEAKAEKGETLENQ